MLRDKKKNGGKDGRDGKRQACGVEHEHQFGFAAQSRKCDTGGRVCCLTNLRERQPGQRAKEKRSGEAFCAFEKLLSSRASLIKAPRVYLALLDSWNFRMITFEERLGGEDNEEEHLSVSTGVM